MQLSFVMAKTFLKLFSRDRQAIIFSLFFPIVFMMVFGLVGNDDEEAISIGIINQANSELTADYISLLHNNPLLEIITGPEADLREQLTEGELSLLLVLPENFQHGSSSINVTILADTSESSQLALLTPVLEQTLLIIERSENNTQALFSLSVENVPVNSQNYLNFVVPGLLAFTIMNISIAGSGYNIVEFRRKGILKRLFVTPIQPKDFIGGLVLSRLLLCLIQLSVLLAVAVFLLGVTFVGNFSALYFIIIIGTVIFLGIGFSLGSIAKTQQSVQAIGSLITFPQVLLSGIFYSIDSLPEFIQPFADLLPLSFVVAGLRNIAVDGLSLMQMLPTLIGLLVWLVVSILLAIKLFVWKDVAS